MGEAHVTYARSVGVNTHLLAMSTPQTTPTSPTTWASATASISADITTPHANTSTTTPGFEIPRFQIFKHIGILKN